MVATSTLVNIDSQQIFQSLGYNADGKTSARVASLVDEYMDNVHPLIEPSYSYLVKDVEWVHGSITSIEDSIIFRSWVIAEQLEKCPKVAVFILTIGNHLGEMVCHLAKEGLVLQATVLDAIGSEAVKKLAVFVQGRVGEVARTMGLCITRRFSPGYCDWNVHQQRMVFRAMNGDCAGVSLTDSCLMLPQKSISGIIGFCSCNNVDKYNPCRTCNEHDCIGRR